MLSLWKHRSTSIIWQLTASFLLILLIPVICNLLIYFEIRKDIQDELNQKNTILFQNIQRSLELTLNEYPQSVSELILDPTMMAVSSLEDPSAPDAGAGGRVCPEHEALLPDHVQRL